MSQSRSAAHDALPSALNQMLAGDAEPVLAGWSLGLLHG